MVIFLEEVLDFKKEISVLVCCSNKNTIFYPPVENIHKNSILRQTIHPAELIIKLKIRHLCWQKK